MKKTTYWVLAVLVCAMLFWSVDVHAHAYMVGDNWGDYPAMAAQAQGILDAMMAEYAGCNLWSTSCNGQTAIWTTIYGQRGPGWVPLGGDNTADHGANRTPGWGPDPTFVRADYHWAFMEEALKPEACMENVPPARIQEIRNAFIANKNRVLSTEVTVYGVRVQASVLGCDNDITRDVTTGGSISLGIKAGSPFCPTVYTVNEGIPSLFGTGNGGPLMNEAHPQLRDLLANMTAAYMTIGDSRVVDYWYAFMGRMALTFVRELLPGLIANIGKSEENNEYAEAGKVIYGAMLEALGEISVEPDKSDKAGCLPWGNVPGVDISKTVSGIPVVGSVTVRATIPDTSVCLSIRTFADKFNCASYTCLPEYLGVKATQGNLNADGRSNLSSWFLANANLQEWKVNEGAGGYLDIVTQPVPPAVPVNYGANYGMTVDGVSSVSIAYQWYAGNAPGSLTPVIGATTKDFSPVIDVYSFNGTNMYKYYRVDLSASYCGTTNVVSSNVVQVQGGTPPAITIFDHPLGGNFYPGQTVTLTVNAGALAGPGLAYQWQKFNTGTSAWDNLPGKTNAVLDFPLIAPADSGQYRAQVLNQVAPSPQYWVFSDAATISVAPAIVISPQPLGAELMMGDSYTITVGASVTGGNLEYRWQRDTGFGFQDLTGWTNAGATSFSSNWDITGAQVSDAGTYRVQVRNTFGVFGLYQVDSEAAVITISSGTVFRVDKLAPVAAPQNGLTWATAFKTIQPAINAAAAAPGGGEVWVAGGPIATPLIYSEGRTEAWGSIGAQGSLVMKTNVRVYGGFEGYRNNTGAKEQYRDQRVIYQNRAVIDGSISRTGLPAYHVVVFGTAAGASTNTVLDGFIIQGGNASGVAGDYHTWRGGGIYNWQSSPIIANCYIANNSAAVAGGGIANEGGPNGSAGATIVNCIIHNNAVAGAADDYVAVVNGINPPWRGAAPNPLRGGGGIFINRSNPTMRFLTVRDNTQVNHTPLDSNNWGLNTAGIFAWSSGPGDFGGSNNSGNILMTNSIVWNNTPGSVKYGKNVLSADDMSVAYGNVIPAWGGSGSNNLDSDPLLDAASVPQTGSPVINSGDPGILAGEYADIRGVPRPVDARVDRGAVEVTTNGPIPACLPTSLNLSDFIPPAQARITDVSRVFDANNTVAEAPIWKIQLQNKLFACGSIPQTTFRVTVTDILGRSNFCDSLVNVTETTPPTPVANPAFTTVDLLPGGQYTLTEDDVNAIGRDPSFDNCGVASASVVPSLFRCSQAGKNVYVTLLVVDFEGNPASKSVLLQIRDVTNPNAVCGSLDVDLNQFGTYTLTQDELATLGGRGVLPNPDTSTDSCGIGWGFTTATINTFTCAHVGAPITVEVYVYDNYGNVDNCFGTVNVYDVTAPTIFGVRPKSFTTYSGDYTVEQALAGVTALDDVCEGDISGDIQVEAFDLEGDPVAFPIPQSYDTGGRVQYPFTLRYTVQDSSGNEAQVESVLNLYDLILPEITVNGADPVILECGNEYIDPGATAIDPATLNDISDQIDTVISVDKDTPGTYTVTYFILIEPYGFYVQEQRTVEVEDTLKPVITLSGDALMGVQAGTPWVEPGYTAFDNCNGYITEDVVVTGIVDTDVPGEYFLYYDVSDGLFDADRKARRVLVGDLFVLTEHPAGKRLYTTDDPYTMGARYVNGLSVSGHEWYRDLDGLGLEAPELGGNTVYLTVDPATHPIGEFDYRLKVYDELGEYSSNPAAIEVQPPMTAGLPDMAMAEGVVEEWKLTVSGGLGGRTYQWYRFDEGAKGMVPVVNGSYPHPTAGPGFYGGATTDTLSFNPYTAAMAGQYQVEITDDFTAIIAGPATLTHLIGAPAAGIGALIALSLAAALGGAAALRKKK